MLSLAGEFPAAAGSRAINRTRREAPCAGGREGGSRRVEIPGSPSACLWRVQRSGLGMPVQGEGGGVNPHHTSGLHGAAEDGAMEHSGHGNEDMFLTLYRENHHQ